MNFDYKGEQHCFVQCTTKSMKKREVTPIRSASDIFHCLNNYKVYQKNHKNRENKMHRTHKSLYR
ncbi:hypothetical protein TTHERM_01135090 (macronuclear) [Tetrahymena thermophila SB210]|uniref:Uncharacterized protein n=1 Tax=Tetrahymena thermophila (strain SB210) TaxID=312017 RepID=Q235T0_TETTS|nr:hypothetical protein TTHERM_01135090 [Tetrahymena thermophila SB210]EAR92276.1 hypothetical protein TTHERM_01135090 [Tetrahymena thermophila SB210]|eukprot:XP_001012521.1 hypothetical protein TTHERM_01135090 [Tetrahymena thermophila SB210]